MTGIVRKGEKSVSPFSVSITKYMKLASSSRPAWAIEKTHLFKVKEEKRTASYEVSCV